MSFEDIIRDLKSRGESHITFSAEGIITSKHGINTSNTWIVKEGQLKCIDCKMTGCQYDVQYKQYSSMERC